jgi:hypothetical protein
MIVALCHTTCTHARLPPTVTYQALIMKIDSLPCEACVKDDPQSDRTNQNVHCTSIFRDQHFTRCFAKLIVQSQAIAIKRKHVIMLKTTTDCEMVMVNDTTRS